VDEPLKAELDQLRRANEILMRNNSNLRSGIEYLFGRLMQYVQIDIVNSVHRPELERVLQGLPPDERVIEG
jgi:hypothetical protein